MLQLQLVNRCWGDAAAGAAASVEPSVHPGCACFRYWSIHNSRWAPCHWRRRWKQVRAFRFDGFPLVLFVCPADLLTSFTAFF